jgi:hypothetical protein
MTADWTVYEYEIDMFRGTLSLCRSDILASYSRHVQNAIVESLLLHTRTLADILLSSGSEADAISLKTLLPGFVPTRLEELKKLYGTRKDVGSPCWMLNKWLAHSTTVRSDSFDYVPMMDKLRPVINFCLGEIEGERSKRGEGQMKQPEASGS